MYNTVLHVSSDGTWPLLDIVPWASLTLELFLLKMNFRLCNCVRTSDYTLRKSSYVSLFKWSFYGDIGQITSWRKNCTLIFVNLLNIRLNCLQHKTHIRLLPALEGINISVYQMIMMMLSLLKLYGCYPLTAFWWAVYRWVVWGISKDHTSYRLSKNNSVA